MSHLTIETIARLVDEPAAPDEAAHLEACAQCRQELEDMRADVARLAALPPLDPPAGEWDAIESRLYAEGLVRRSSAFFPGWRTALLRMAAALVFFLLGTAAGAAWLGRGNENPVLATTGETVRGVTTPAPLVDRPSVDSRSVAVQAGEEVRTPARPASQPRAELPPGLRANPQLAAFLRGEAPASYDEAVQFYREAEGLYLGALTRMAELGGGSDYGDPYARLAALEAITSITRAALGQAPADPVLNGYHVTALAQRDATLRQIAARTAGSWF